MSQRTAVIVGAGPAGLTAAAELLARTDVRPIVLETDSQVGGIAKTVVYKGNRIDIGGHRFFSKSDRVMDWWLARLPLERTERREVEIHYQGKRRSTVAGPRGVDASTDDRVMLLRERKSRIYFRRRLFDYPVRLTPDTFAKLGWARSLRIGWSYLAAVVRPTGEPANLEEFFVGRFGRELYETFFKAYTEKVWGVPCREISAAWGAQRVKGLSVTTAAVHFLRSLIRSSGGGARQNGTETSLIERFLYPKLGPGQLWEEVAREVRDRGGEIRTSTRAERLLVEDGRVVGVALRDRSRDTEETLPADFVFSSMPLRELVAAIEPGRVPRAVREVAEGLVYRDFFTVGLLARRLALSDPGTGRALPQDNWIYIQEPDVDVGRLQIFNNWSPWLVADPQTVWVGLEYFCNEGEPLWRRSDDELVELGKRELAQIGILDAAEVLDGTVVRMPKAYPAYLGSYDRLYEIRDFLDRLPNLFPIGRNGMHRYNNQDHSMLTAMVAVDNIVQGRVDKANVWAVNAEQDYHEQKTP